MPTALPVLILRRPSAVVSGVVSLMEFKFSKRLVSSSNTLFRAKSCWTIGEGLVIGFKSKEKDVDAGPELPEPLVEAEFKVAYDSMKNTLDLQRK